MSPRPSTPAPAHTHTHTHTHAHPPAAPNASHPAADHRGDEGRGGERELVGAEDTAEQREARVVPAQRVGELNTGDARARARSHLFVLPRLPGHGAQLRRMWGGGSAALHARRRGNAFRSHSTVGAQHLCSAVGNINPTPPCVVLRFRKAAALYTKHTKVPKKCWAGPAPHRTCRASTGAPRAPNGTPARARAARVSARSIAQI